MQYMYPHTCSPCNELNCGGGSQNDIITGKTIMLTLLSPATVWKVLRVGWRGQQKKGQGGTPYECNRKTTRHDTTRHSFCAKQGSERMVLHTPLCTQQDIVCNITTTTMENHGKQEKATAGGNRYICTLNLRLPVVILPSAKVKTETSVEEGEGNIRV